MWAVESGNIATVRILLEHGADINTKNEHGKFHSSIVTISIYPSICISIYIYLYSSLII